MASRIQVRRDTAANWTANNPTLSSGEIGFVTNENKIKIGDGQTPWNSLSYLEADAYLDSVVMGDDTTGNYVETLIASDGISISGEGAESASVTITNTGVLSLAGTNGEIDVSASSGNITLSLPTSITVDLVGSVTGNADTASTLATARSISLGGDLSGSASFDGGADITITATVADDSHDHTIANIDGLQTELSNLATSASASASAVASDLSEHEGLTTNVHGIADTSLLATKEYADNSASAAAAALVDSAPEALNTLNELAAALGDDANFSTTVTNSLAEKLSITSASATYLTQTDAATLYETIGSASAVASDLTDHENSTTNVHGIADTSLLATESYADSSASAAQSAAESYADSLAVNYDSAGSASAAQSAAESYADSLAVNYDAAGSASAVASDLTDHENATTNVHGITDTSELATKTYADNAGVTSLSGTASEIEVSASTGSVILSLPSTINADTTGNAATASALETSRAISLGGDLSGSASFNGGSDITITAAVADDSHNHVISNVDGLQTALNAKAPLDSPALTGTPTAPTASASTNSTQIATTAFVQTNISNLINGAPGALNTLDELAAALGDDANFASTVTNSLAGKQPLDADLTAIADLSASATGFLKKDGNNSWSLDGNTYLTGNQSITLSGDVSGSGTTEITVTVADDSHNHIISNVDGLQNALDAKLDSASYTASDALTKIKTVDGAGSGLDSDLLDGQHGSHYLDWTNTTNKPDPTITLGGDASGSLTLTDLAGGTLNVTVADNSHNHTSSNISDFTESVQDTVGGMVSTNTESGISVTYDDTNGKLNFDVNDPNITLSGDVSGSATMTNLGNVTITTTVADDSHNHIISNVDGLQTALDAKLDSSSYTAADVLNKIKTVDGSTSGLDADLLDGQDGSHYLDWNNTTNKPDPTITLGGDASGSLTLTDLTGGTLTVTVADDSHNHIISNVDGLQTALDAKAPLDSPTLTGIPTAPTASASANSTQIATTAFVQTAVSNVIDGAPGALNTLNELAAALGDDANFASTVTNSLAEKQPLDADLSAIAGLSASATGFLVKDGENVWSVDNSNYLTGNETITVSGDATGSGSTSISLTLANSGVSASTYGSSLQIPVLAVDAKGRITSASVASVEGLPSQTNNGGKYLTTNGTVASWDTINLGTDTDGDYVARLSVSGEGLSVTGSGESASVTLSNTGVTSLSGTANEVEVSASSGSVTLSLPSTINANTTGSAATLTTARAISLGGDVSGSASFNGGSNITITATVADDSHNHVISNVDGLQTALDAKLDSSSYTAADVLTKIKTVDGTTSGLDADLLDGQHGSHYLDWTNTTNKPDPTITLGGDASGSLTLTDLAGGTLTVTIADDSHNHIISNVDGLQTALDAKAPLESPALSGTPTAPTASASANSTQIATTAFVQTAVSNLINGAPGALNTLDELAAALGDDANFATTITNSLAGKQPLDADLTAIAALAGTSGFLKKTATDTWTLDTNTYLTGNQSISVSGDATGSGTTSISLTLANSGVTANSYGSASSVPTFTVDAKGRLTAASNTAIAIAGSAITSGTIPGNRGVTAGSTSSSFVEYNGTTATAGQFYGGTTTPTGTTRLNYGGYFYPTFINLVGSADTATAATHYFVETGSDGFVRPKTIANVRTEIVTTAAVNSAAATTVGTITSGTWSATDIGLAHGGTNASLTAANGAVVYSTASALALTSVGTAGQVLTSNGAGAPTWQAPASGGFDGFFLAGL